MKRLFLMCLLCASLTNYAQEWTKKIDDPDFHSRRSRGLKIGDPMPDISLGSVWNNKTGKTHFSDFKGKLVILDFWSQNCASCIAAFPKMEKLQKEFRDEIQIFLINPWEKVDEVVEHFKKVKKEDLKMPDLPCIEKSKNSDELLKLLPVIGVTTQVWIDQDGKITLMGSPINNTSKKIRDFLNGKEIYRLNNNTLNPVFDPTYPYAKLLGDFISTPLKSSSTFTEFNNEYQAMNARTAKEVKDSVAKTIRNTYVNTDVLDLYAAVFEEVFGEQNVKILYSDGSSLKSTFFSPLRFCLSTIVLPKDTIRYTANYGELSERNMDDFIYRKPKFCYEQILPITATTELQKKYMLEDLNRYFGSLYGSYGRVEKRTIPCYVLVKLGGNANVKVKTPDTQNPQPQGKKKKINKNEESHIKYGKFSLGSIGDLIALELRSVKKEFSDNKKNNKPSIFVNETGLIKSQYIDFELPNPEIIKSMEDYRKALNQNGFDIKIENRTLNFLVITDTSGK